MSPALARAQARYDDESPYTDSEPPFAFEESQVERCERAFDALGSDGSMDDRATRDVLALLDEHAEWLTMDCPADADALTLSDYQEAIDGAQHFARRIRKEGNIPADAARTIRCIFSAEVLPRLRKDLASAKRAAEHAADVWGDAL